MASPLKLLAKSLDRQEVLLPKLRSFGSAMSSMRMPELRSPLVRFALAVYCETVTLTAVTVESPVVKSVAFVCTSVPS